MFTSASSNAFFILSGGGFSQTRLVILSRPYYKLFIRSKFVLDRKSSLL